MPTVNNATSLFVSWNRIDHATNYRVEWSTVNTFPKDARTDAKTVSQTDLGNAVTTIIDGLTAETLYYVRVTAVSESVDYYDSKVSNMVMGRPNARVLPLSTPVLREVSLVNPTTVSVSWDRVENATDYIVEFSTDENFPEGGVSKQSVAQPASGSMAPAGMSIAMAPRNFDTITAEIPGLTLGKRYYFRVMAVAAGSQTSAPSPPSDHLGKSLVRQPLPTPTIARPFTSEDGVVIVTWSGVTNASSYVVEYATTSTFTGAKSATSDGNGSRVELTDLNLGVTYYFRVMAIGTGEYDNSTWSLTESHIRLAKKLVAEIHPASVAVQESCYIQLSGVQAASAPEAGLTYLWDLTGNGEYNVEGVTVKFSTDLLDTKPGGIHTVWHKVRDTEGNESEPISADLNIVAVAPTYEVSGPQEKIFEKTPTYWEFSAVTSSFRPIKDWEINWGDGSEPTQILGGPRSRISVTHYFREAGTYTVTIKTTDFDGLVTTVTIGPYEVKERVAASEWIPESLSALDTPEFLCPAEPTPLYALSENYIGNDLADLTEIMRQRQMLDLDQSGQKSESVTYPDLIWDDELFGDEWFDFTESETGDFWSEVFEEELLAIPAPQG